VKVIVWLEPEKSDLIRFIPDIVKPILKDVADIVVPKRSDKSWQTYPSYLRDLEADAHKMFCELSGESTD
jgi:hypothetical protein